MKRMAWIMVLVSAQALVAHGAPPEPARQPPINLNGHNWSLPKGFDIELIAGPPLVDRPIVADFDERGRLYVADSSGSNENVQLQLQKRPHRILRLEDTDGDGRFDKRTVFADKMMFPEGVMYYDGSVYVAAPPSIWKLTDTDGDGIADQRIEWFKGKTLTGCANDLHGPYLGLDGWIYWCKGAFAEQTYDRPGRKPLVTRAAHIFRARPDGSGIEPVMTGGMDNPVDVVFTPEGERIFTTTFLVHPGGGKRDGLIHAIYGGVYGKDHPPVHSHPWTGPSLLPALVHLGAAAPCGLTTYDSQVFGASYRHNLFACLFNMHKVMRFELVPNGSTYQTRNEDFLVSDNLDFHPTDVLADADGSLVVIDTGGWYKLCCPTSQLHKPDILGGIYRIRRNGAASVADPRGLSVPWSSLTGEQLTGLLGDSRPAVRRRAMKTLAVKGASGIEHLRGAFKAASMEAQLNAIWTATRIDHPSARKFVRDTLAVHLDDPAGVAAAHSISVWRDKEARPLLVRCLDSRGMHNRRAAAEALGRLGESEAIPALFEAVGRGCDQILEHSLTYALMEIGDRAKLASGLDSNNPRVRKAALVAIDQGCSNGLQPTDITPALAAEDPDLRKTAWWLAGRHPQWGSAVAGFLRHRLSADHVDAAEREELGQRLARFAADRTIRELIVAKLREREAGPDVRRLVIRSMGAAGLKEPPATWVDGLVEVIAKENGELLAEAVKTARTLQLGNRKAPKLAEALLHVGSRNDLPILLRLGALAAVPGGLAKVEDGLFKLLCDQLGSEQSVQVRGLAVDILARSRLDVNQLVSLTAFVRSVHPTERDRLLDAFAQSGETIVGLKLVAVLIEPAVRPGLRAETIRPRFAKFGPQVEKELPRLLAALDADTAQQRTRLEQLLKEVKSGDIRRGQAVFHSTKAACAACHALGYLGGTTGPDLTHIGKIRNERDLLESIVFPSASLVRSYESVAVATRSGKLHNGLVRKDSPEELVLATGVDQEVRIARGDIEEVRPSTISIMPAGLEQQLSVRDLADLVAFLKACQ